MKLNDLTGLTFGELTVQSLVPRDKLTEKQLRENKRYWLCSCSCGSSKITSTGQLTQGHTTSCGCARKAWQASTVIDLAGTSNAFLTYTGEAGYRKGKRWITCLCACGKSTEIQSAGYISGRTKSCGCYNRKGSFAVEERSNRIRKNSTIDLTGLTYHYWTVISQDKTTEYNGTGARWNCVCKCGTKRTISSNSLRTGSSKSCGCYNYRKDKASNAT